MIVAPSTKALMVASAQMNSQMSRFPWDPGTSVVTLGVDPCPGAAGTPAWYIDALGSVVLDLATIYDDQATLTKVVNAIATVGHTEIPSLLYGFVAHELAHANWSSWTPDPGTPTAVSEVMSLFEELRIESRVADWKGADGVRYLRHSFHWLLMKTAEKDIDMRPPALAGLWALIYGRYLASIASRAEVDPLDTAARTALTDDTVDVLQEILSEAIITSSIRRLRELAEEWIDLLKTDDDDAAGRSSISLVLHADGDGDNNDKPDSGGGADAEEREVIKQALDSLVAEMVPSATPSASIDLADPAKSKVFSHRRTTSGSSNWTERDPDPKLRQDALRFTRTLESLALPSIALTHVPSQLPPGRLRGREAVRQSAERDMGLMSTATPWRSTKRTRSHTKPVIVATMTDTSGSMRWAQNFVADFAWMMSTAGTRIGARSAAVTFGNNAEMVTRPGEVPQKVRVRSSNGGQEAFDEAAAAIEKVLMLSTPTNAAKVVFVVSDGELVIANEKQRAARWLEKWTKAGVLVCWIGADHSCWHTISSRVRSPGKAINIPVSTHETDSIIKRMESEVIQAARGMQ